MVNSLVLVLEEAKSPDVTVTCTSSVASTSVQAPAVTSDPAMSFCGEIDVSTGSSDVAPVPRLEPNLIPVRERVPAVEHSSPPLSEPADSVPVVERVPVVEHCS